MLIHPKTWEDRERAGSALALYGLVPTQPSFYVPTGASLVWDAVEGCRWYPCHLPVSRGVQALSYMNSCMCWASGMSTHGLTGTAISVSTGMKSFQVNQVVHRPGWA